jgi:RHS repeat-associated protein
VQSNGVLVSQTTGNTTTTYLNDPNNPTGYTKAIQSTTTIGTNTTTTSYVLGLKVEAQSTSATGGNVVVYLLTDAHGSTRALVNTAGQIAATSGISQIFDYDAFGTALDFNAATADTPWLFGGDGFYDPATGWTYHLARWTNGFWFTQMDTISQTPGNLATANLYVYAAGNPLNTDDPSGHIGVGEVEITETIGEDLDASLDEEALAASDSAEESVQAFNAEADAADAEAIDEADGEVPWWLQLSAIIASVGIAGGGVVYTQNGSPSTPLSSLTLAARGFSPFSAANV